MSDSENYWFPAKKYGWGWGVSRVWQGWAVLLVAGALLIAGAFFFPPKEQPILFQVHTWSVVLVLLGICWLKGEPQRGRRRD